MEFCSKITVELMAAHGSDEGVCQSAWVSSKNERVTNPDETRQRGLINALMRERHGTVFESGYFEFRIDAPAAVRSEHTRHRVGWSYSSASSRYRELPLKFYVPPRHRPLQKASQFKQLRPVYDELSEEEYAHYVYVLQSGYSALAHSIQNIKATGRTETEAIRWLNPDGLYIPYYARCNPRSLMHFLALRTHDPDANHVSFPMWEIEQVARQIENYFKQQFPITYAAFNEFGREAP